MGYIYATKDLDYIDVMPWYGWILAILIGTAIMGFFVLLIIAVCRFDQYLEENNYTCHNFGIRKRLCKIKLWKFR